MDSIIDDAFPLKATLEPHEVYNSMHLFIFYSNKEVCTNAIIAVIHIYTIVYSNNS